MIRLTIIIGLIGLFGPGLLFSQQSEYQKFGVETSKGKPSGLKVGHEAPDFSLKDQDGNTFRLASEIEDAPVVMFFYRGYWCPVCNKYLNRYADSLSMVTERGVKVIAITPESYENVEKTRSKTGVDIRVLSDKNQQVMKKYKVAFHVSDAYQQKIQKVLSADIARTNNQKDAQLPVPATYIINTDRQIVARQFDVNYKNRASVRWVLENLPK
jgi:peroxiredoxin